LAAWLLSVFFVASAAADLRDLARLESRSYVIHTNLSPIEARDFGRHMDLIYREYSKRFSVLRGQGRGKQNLYLLRTRDDYVNAMAEFGIDASATGGMFFWGGGRSGLATWVEGLSRDQVFSTLQHEGFHQFAHSKLGRELPLWVNEGLAEYFGSAIVVQDKVRLGIVDADRVEKLRTALRQNRALPFDELLHTTSQQWFANMNNGSDRGHLQYDQSWSIVHFLIHGDKGRYQKAFENYLVLISRGRDHDEAFAKSFGTTNTGPFAQRWLKFIDEVEPDDYSTALKRIQFLGAALEFLRGQPGVEMPGDLETLRTMLQERQFRLTRMTEAGASVIEASDDALYGYTDAGGKPQPFVVVRGEEVDLPPRLTAEHLDPAVTLIWARDAEGHLRSQLVYE
jgi:hypothetical protein